MRLGHAGYSGSLFFTLTARPFYRAFVAVPLAVVLPTIVVPFVGVSSGAVRDCCREATSNGPRPASPHVDRRCHRIQVAGVPAPCSETQVIKLQVFRVCHGQDVRNAVYSVKLPIHTDLSVPFPGDAPCPHPAQRIEPLDEARCLNGPRGYAPQNVDGLHRHTAPGCGTWSVARYWSRSRA